MYYEFYLDIYFLENLVMNCLVLHMAARMRKVFPSRGRTVLAGALGACVLCAAVVSPIHKSKALTMLCGAASYPVMALAAYGKKEAVQNMAVIAGVSLILGAIWQFLRIQLAMPFFAAVPGGYLLACIVWDGWRRKKSRTKYIYDVTLQRGKNEISLKALLDSGNRLVQPVTLRPVHIVDFEQLRKLLSKEETEELEDLLKYRTQKTASGKFTYVPFQSIGGGEGVLPVMALDGIRVKHGESAWSAKGILVAVSKKAVSGRGEYQMILHPRILE